MQPNARLKFLKCDGQNRMVTNEIASKFSNLKEFHSFYTDRSAEGELKLGEESLHPLKQLKKVGFSNFASPTSPLLIVCLKQDYQWNG